MNQEQVQQVIDMVQAGITKMAETMGVAVPRLWEIVVRQQMVEAIQAIVLFGLVCLLVGIYFLVMRKVMMSDFAWEKHPYDDNKTLKDSVSIPLIMSGIVLAAIFVSSAMGFMLDSVIGKLLNPEYYAIQDIADFVRGPQ